MTNTINKVAACRCAVAASCLMMAQVATADTLLKYDDFSFFEEGAVLPLGQATLSFNGLLDQAYTADPRDSGPKDKTTLQLSARLAGQLSNGWNVGLQYLGTVKHSDGSSDDSHRYALYADAAWGALFIGDVTAQLDNALSRHNAVGNAALSQSRALGGLDAEGLHFKQTFNAYELHVAADRNGDYQLGVMFEAPIAKGSRSFGVRLGTGKLENRSPALGSGRTEGLSAFAGYSQGAWHFGAEIGAEWITLSGAQGSERQTFGSIGATYKTGRTSLSAEIGQSRFNGVTNDSAALGLRYDVVRGLSVNLGANYSDNGTKSDWEIPFSIRYEF